MPLRLVTFNINGLRSGVESGLLDWIADRDFDVICFQETKIREQHIPTILIQELGYSACWHHAQKAGYSGVATFSKVPPRRIIAGSGIAKYDAEGRVLRTDHAGFTILNCYFPNGKSGPQRQEFKMRFLDDLYGLVDNLLREQPGLIVLGDYNIAHTEKDLNDPSRHRNASGFLPDERAWMTEFFQNGMTDAFRYRYPDKVEYSFWRFNARARQQNKGWRLDYVAVSDALVGQIVDVQHLREVEFSDHCPVLITLQEPAEREWPGR